MAKETWEYGIVALIDILGFSDLVESDASSQEPEHLSRLVDSIRKARDSNVAKNLYIRAFSDSIIIAGQLSAKDASDIFSATADLQRNFIPQKILIRGAVALGKHYSDADSIYSEALVRAYKLEKEHARFPRVLIDDQLLDWLMNDPGTSNAAKAAIRSLSLKDRDGRVFIHYLSPDSITAHKDLITSYNPHELSASVLEKLQWSANYQNYVATSVNGNQIISGPLVNGFSPI
jgi:hypothetical protein